MTALPSPSITSPPAVPSDLAAVAQAIENQAVAAYAGYNTTNTPSATSLENRVNAIDVQPGGTASALDGQISTLNANIATWTAGSGSKLGIQTAQTALFGPRQDSQDASMSSITAGLVSAESQISTLTSQRPGGVLASGTINANVDVTQPTVIVYITRSFNPARWYRVSFSGTAQSTVGNTNQDLSASWVLSPGTSPSINGNLAGVSTTPLSMTSYQMPMACYGVFSGFSGTYTIALNAHTDAPGTTGCKIVGLCSYSLEDLGYRYY